MSTILHQSQVSKITCFYFIMIRVLGSCERSCRCSIKPTFGQRRKSPRTYGILELVSQMRLVLFVEITISSCDPGTLLGLRSKQLALLLLEQAVALIDEPLVQISDHRLNENTVFIVLAHSHDKRQILLHSISHHLHKRQLLDLLRIFVYSCRVTLHCCFKYFVLIIGANHARLLVEPSIIIVLLKSEELLIVLFNEVDEFLAQIIVLQHIHGTLAVLGLISRLYLFCWKQRRFGLRSWLINSTKIDESELRRKTLLGFQQHLLFPGQFAIQILYLRRLFGLNRLLIIEGAITRI